MREGSRREVRCSDRGGKEENIQMVQRRLD